MSNFTRGMNRISNPAQASINAPISTNQIRNDAGGYVYRMNDLDRMAQFLVLGTTSSYYTSDETMLTRNLLDVRAIAYKKPFETLQLINDINAQGISQKYNALILVATMLIFHDDNGVRLKAKFTLGSLVRTGYHALSYLTYLNSIRDMEKSNGRKVGFGRAKVSVLKNWAESLTARELVLQRIKYHNRDGMRLEDVFNFAHPNLESVGPLNNLVGKWIMDNLSEDDEQALNELIIEGNTVIGQIKAWAEINNNEISVAHAAELIREFQIPREGVPTQFLREIEVWQALLPSMPDHALIRNLSTMLNNGTFATESEYIMNRLRDTEKLQKSRVTPMDVLKAWGIIHTQGNPVLTNQLERTFFDLVKVQKWTNANVLVAVDVSGSMSIPVGDARNRTGIRAIEAATGMAQAIRGNFSSVDIVGFDMLIRQPSGMETLNTNFWTGWGGGTDASIVVRLMNETAKTYDAVIFITDNDAWLGRHVQELIKEYRKKRNVNTVLMVNSTASQGYTLADPNDDLSLDLSGFNTGIIEALQWKLASVRNAG